MSGVVDRLLAQLPGLQEHRSAETVRRAAAVGTGFHSTSDSEPSTEPDLIGLGARLVLVIALSLMMVAWPYDRSCGLPLSAYLCAVVVVILGGGWTAMTAWKLRAPLAHIVSLILVFWGLVLAADVLLPRIGYAAQQADWQCEDAYPPLTPTNEAPVQ